jgi:hypothetical protein
MIRGIGGRYDLPSWFTFFFFFFFLLLVLEISLVLRLILGFYLGLDGGFGLLCNGWFLLASLDYE